MTGTTRTALSPGARQAYDRLAEAWQHRRCVPPVREFLSDAGGAGEVAAAYSVQQALIEDQLGAGATVSGRKIGLTAPAVQAQLGVDQPDFGVLLDTMECPPGRLIEHTRLLQPRIEAEVAFVLAADVTDPAVDAVSVRGSVACAVAALEIVDSRIDGWDITLLDTVADNASSGLYTLGTTRVPLSSVEPRTVTMSMTVNGAEVSVGSGSACLGDPLNALAWLARTAIAFGAPLRAGQVILSGALGPMVPVPPGAHVSATISGLGTVDAAFTGP